MTQRLPRLSCRPGCRFSSVRRETPARTASTTVSTTRAGWGEEGYSSSPAKNGQAGIGSSAYHNECDYDESLYCCDAPRGVLAVSVQKTTEPLVNGQTVRVKRRDTVGHAISTPHGYCYCGGFSRFLGLQRPHMRGTIFGIWGMTNSIGWFVRDEHHGLRRITASPPVPIAWGSLEGSMERLAYGRRLRIFSVLPQGDDPGIQVPWHPLPGATGRAFLCVSMHGLGECNGPTTLPKHHKA